jgi:hypothetical protein
MSLAGFFFDIGDASPNAQLGASSAKDPERSRLASFLLFSPFLVLYFDCLYLFFSPQHLFFLVS